MDKKKNYWDISYKNNDNLLFYPNEEVIRFFNKFVRRKTKNTIIKNNKIVVDIGCGSGRHLLYCLDNGYIPIGLDISNVALKQAKLFLRSKEYFQNKDYKLIKSNSSKMNIKSDTIDYIISHATLDSMNYKDMTNTVKEIYRILKKNSLGYVDLISDKVKRKGKFLNKYDQLIYEKHERKTIQSYFNMERIKKTFKKFKILEIYRIDKVVNKKLSNARYSVILKK